MAASKIHVSLYAMVYTGAFSSLSISLFLSLSHTHKYTATPQPVQCLTQEYPCMDRMECIPDSLLCDGTEQCCDGSDELTCRK